MANGLVRQRMGYSCRIADLTDFMAKAERFSSFSSASACQDLFPQPLHVAHRWDTEEAFVLPIKWWPTR